MAHIKRTLESIQGTQITVESVFISRFTMNNIAPKLQKRWTHKIAFKIVSKMLKQPNSFRAGLLHFRRTHLQSFIFLRLLVYV